MPEPSRFEALVVPHLDAGYNLARWLVREARDAEDVVQDACVRALRYLDSLQGDAARPWFLTIVRHASYDFLARRRGEAAAGEFDIAELEVAADAASEPECQAARRSVSRALAHALAGLALPYREVIVLRELEELSYREIATIAGIPIGTVMSRLARSRAALKAKWLQEAEAVPHAVR